MAGFDIYQAVTDRILDLLDQGIAPWKNPIRGAAGEWPKNLNSGRPYRGVNVFLLAMTAWSKGYDSPYWVSFKQAQERGGSVQKGEKSTLVVFWKQLEKENPETGKIEKLPLLRYYNVFNAAAQCIDVPVPAIEIPGGDQPFSPIEEAERIVQEFPNPPAIQHQGHRAYYRPSNDTVTLPPPERFDTAEHYYATAFHELTHATGAKHRLNRGLGKTIPPFGSADYSKEELVAEMGAAFLSAVAGISAQTIEASASYINGWRNRLQDDKRLVVAAAGQAQRAADLILGTHWSDTDQDSATVQAITGACDHTPPSSGPARSFTPSR